MQVRIDYLKIVSQLPLYGAALFAMELQNNIINLVRDQGYLGTFGLDVLSPHHSFLMCVSLVVSCGVQLSRAVACALSRATRRAKW